MAQWASFAFFSRWFYLFTAGSIPCYIPGWSGGENLPSGCAEELACYSSSWYSLSPQAEFWSDTILFFREIYPLPHGRHQKGENYLNVSRGVGTWGPPMRLGSAPELVYIVLRTKKE
jgi:hypothetical protein